MLPYERVFVSIVFYQNKNKQVYWTMGKRTRSKRIFQFFGKDYGKHGPKRRKNRNR